MNWQTISTESDWETLLESSSKGPQVVYKHSTRCSLSSVAKSRLDRAIAPEGVTFYYLDLIRYRDISNRIAEDMLVQHESPQVLVIKDGKCVYHESHMAITMDDILKAATF